MSFVTIKYYPAFTLFLSWKITLLLFFSEKCSKNSPMRKAERFHISKDLWNAFQPRLSKTESFQFHIACWFCSKRRDSLWKPMKCFRTLEFVIPYRHSIRWPPTEWGDIQKVDKGEYRKFFFRFDYFPLLSLFFIENILRTAGQKVLFIFVSVGHTRCKNIALF